MEPYTQRDHDKAVEDGTRVEIATSRTGGAGVTVRGGMLVNDALAATNGIVVREVVWDDRPTHSEFQSGVCVSNNNLNGYYRWRVATTGAITYWCSVTAIRESPLCMTWVTNDTFTS